MKLVKTNARCGKECAECGTCFQTTVQFSELNELSGRGDGPFNLCQSCLSKALDLFEPRVPGKSTEEVFASGIAEPLPYTIQSCRAGVREILLTLLRGNGRLLNVRDSSDVIDEVLRLTIPDAALVSFQIDTNGLRTRYTATCQFKDETFTESIDV